MSDLLGSKRPLRDALILALGVLITGGAVAVSVLANTGGRWMLPVDDSYIYLEYARNLAHGEALRYNLGDAPTFGATSQLYVLLLSSGAILGLDGDALAVFAFVLNGVLGLAFLLILRDLLETGGHPATALLGAIAVLVTGVFIWGVFSGLEIALSLLVFALAVHAVMRDRGRSTRPVAVPWFSLMTLMRPEAAVFSFLASLTFGFDEVRRRRFNRAVWWLLPLAVLVAYLALTIVLAGHPGPSTSRPKSPLFTPTFSLVFVIRHALEFFAEVLRLLTTGTAEGGVFLVPLAGFLFLVGAVPRVTREWEQRVIGPHTLIFAWILLGILMVTVASGSSAHHFRYLTPYLALLVAYIPAGVVALSRAVLARQIVEARVLGTVLVAVVLGVHLASGVRLTIEFGRMAAGLLPYRDVAEHVRTALPPGARIAALDVGILAYVGNRPVFDLFGLVTPEMTEVSRFHADSMGSVYERIERMPTAERPSHSVVYRVRYDEHGDEAHLEPWRQRLLYRSRVQVPGVPVIGEDLGLYELFWPPPGLGAEPTCVSLADLGFSLQLVREYDVADPINDRSSAYRNLPVVPGVFPANRWLRLRCGDAGPAIWDGALGVARGERLLFESERTGPLVLVSRLAAIRDAPEVRVNGALCATGAPPARGGWVETIVMIPAELVRSGQNVIELHGSYLAAHHWLYRIHQEISAEATRRPPPGDGRG